MVRRRTLLLVLAGALAGAALAGGLGRGGSADAQQGDINLRVARLEATVSRLCTSFRLVDVRSFHDYDGELKALVGSVKAACALRPARAAQRHEDNVRPRRPKPHEDTTRPPPPPPPHEG